MYLFLMTLTKLAVLAMYWRIFPSGFAVLRRGCIALGALSVAWLVAGCVLTVLQCRPLRMIWSKNVPGQCFDPATLAIGMSVPNMAIDLAILLLPVYEISRLSMALAQKTAIAAIFLLGLL